jgi:hypothetical protein
MLEFPCPHCGARLQFPLQQTGGHGRCPSCKRNIAAPLPRHTSEAITADAPVARAATTTAITPDQVLPQYPTARIRRRTPAPDREKQELLASLRGRVGCVPAIVLTILGGLALFCLIWPACQLVNQAANRSQTASHMKEIGLACHRYQDMHKMLPTPKMILPKGKKEVELSWRVSILPFLDEQAQFDLFDRSKGWGSPGNAAVAKPMPSVFDDPMRVATNAKRPSTYFQYFTGPDTLWPGNAALLSQDIPDGESNTFLFAESATAVPWSKPADMIVRPDQPLPLPAPPAEGGIWFVACFADGTVRFLQTSTSEATSRLLINPRDGAPVPDF